MATKILKKYATTQGQVSWSDTALFVESVPDPVPPDGSDDWKMVGSVALELRNSYQLILWFWEAPADPPALEPHCGRKAHGCYAEQYCGCTCSRCEW